MKTSADCNLNSALHEKASFVFLVHLSLFDSFSDKALNSQALSDSNRRNDLVFA